MIESFTILSMLIKIKTSTKSFSTEQYKVFGYAWDKETLEEN